MRLSLIALSAMIPSTALAWPADGDWIPVTQGGVVMEDPASDHRHSDVGMGSHLDLVGDQNDHAFQWWADMNKLYVRVLLNSDPTDGSNSFLQGSWGIAIDLDGDTSTLEYMLTHNGDYGVTFWEYDFDGTMVESELNKIEELTGGDGAGTVNSAGSNLDGTPDWHLDLQIKWDYLAGVDPNNPFTEATAFSLLAVTGENYVEDELNVDIAGFDDSQGFGGVADGLSDPLGWDSDGDELSNAQEINAGTDPYDADTDDDGLSDYEEYVSSSMNPLECDSDSDGLSDGLERGVVTPLDDTDTAAGCFQEDMDPTSLSNPGDADSDLGGADDGLEDWNFDGAETPFEGNLMDPSDDGDTDSDGVPDFAEDGCDLDNFSVNDADSDADGLDDATEGWKDTDSDGYPDFCDTDSDGDGISDGDEGEEDTDDDGIPNWQDPDSDGDGIPDAEESPVGDADCDGIPDVLDESHDDQCDDNEDTGLNGNYGDLKGGTYSGGACSSTGSSSPSLLPFLIVVGMLGFRRRGTWLALLLPGLAHADEIEQDNNSLAVNAQRFRSATDSAFFTLEDGHIGPASQLGASLLFNHAQNPLVYRYDDPTQADFPLLESVSTAELTTWYNLPGFRIGAVLPLHLASSGYEVDGFRMIGDIRLLASWAALSSDNFNLTATADFSVPSGNEETWLGDDSSVGDLSVQAGYRTERFLAVAHLGYRYYFNGVPLKDTNWGSRLTVGLGGAYRVTDAAQLTLETSGEFLSKTYATANTAHTKPFEAIGGARYAVWKSLEVSAGAGAGITQGVGTPDWRGIVGLHWNRSASFADPTPITSPPAGIPSVSPAPEEVEEPIPTGWIRVIATNEGNLPVACSVRVLGTGQPPISGGQDGWTELELPAGTHEVVVWAEGYQSFHTDIDVTADGKTDIKVVLPGGKVAIEGDQVRVFEKIFFELDSTEIKVESFGLLDEVVELLLNHPEITLMTIEGHTDDQGDAQYNVDLSFGRAEAVVHYLNAQGIERERLQARGLGESKPILPGESEESRAANRRVEFHIRERLPEIP